MRRVLVIRFSSLGDIILTFPSIKFLADLGNEVHVFTKNSFVPLIKLHGVATHIHSIPDHASSKELFTKISELRTLGFEVIYDLHRNLRSRLTTILLGRPFWRVRKFRFKEWFLFIFRRQLFLKLGLRPIDRAAEAFHLVSLRQEKRFLLGRGVTVTSIELTSEISKPLSTFKRGYICVAAESAWQQKQWPVSRFIGVAKAIQGQGIGIVWVGLNPLPGEANFMGSLDLTGRLNLCEVAKVLQGSRLLLSNDSGLMHLAEAVRTPIVALFGPTTGELGFAPKLIGSRIVEKSLWCRPCSKTGRLCIRPIARRKCLTDISIGEVLVAIKTVLESPV